MMRLAVAVPETMTMAMVVVVVVVVVVIMTTRVLPNIVTSRKRTMRCRCIRNRDHHPGILAEALAITVTMVVTGAVHAIPVLVHLHIHVHLHVHLHVVQKMIMITITIEMQNWMLVLMFWRILHHHYLQVHVPVRRAMERVTTLIPTTRMLVVVVSLTRKRK